MFILANLLTMAREEEQAVDRPSVLESITVVPKDLTTR
jgi:hypothetical protein